MNRKTSEQRRFAIIEMFFYLICIITAFVYGIWHLIIDSDRHLDIIILLLAVIASYTLAEREFPRDIDVNVNEEWEDQEMP